MNDAMCQCGHIYDDHTPGDGEPEVGCLMCDGSDSPCQGFVCDKPAPPGARPCLGLGCLLPDGHKGDHDPQRPQTPAASGEDLMMVPCTSETCCEEAGRIFDAPAPAPSGAVRMHRIVDKDGKPSTDHWGVEWRWQECRANPTPDDPCFFSEREEHADFYPASALAAKDEEIARLREAHEIAGEGIGRRNAALAEAKREIERLREALEEIAAQHQSYESNPGGQYGIGVTDGHRCAAKIANAALAADRKEKP